MTSDTASKKKLAKFWSKAPYSGFRVLGDGVKRPILWLGLWMPNLFDLEALRQVKIPKEPIFPE